MVVMLYVVCSYLSLNQSGWASKNGLSDPNCMFLDDPSTVKLKCCCTDFNFWLENQGVPTFAGDLLPAELLVPQKTYSVVHISIKIQFISTSPSIKKGPKWPVKLVLIFELNIFEPPVPTVTASKE